MGSNCFSIFYNVTSVIEWTINVFESHYYTCNFKVLMQFILENIRKLDLCILL